jgi:hypothetical protein
MPHPRPKLTRALLVAALTLTSTGVLACSRPTPQPGSTSQAPGPNVVEPTRDPNAPYPPVYPTAPATRAYPAPDGESDSGDATGAITDTAEITATSQITATTAVTP